MVCLVLLAGCQDYNFNPVGKCVIQPGATQIRLDEIGTADILFVIDDSGSMQSQQESLARNFAAFIDELAKTQTDRVNRGLQAFDFHIAITTSAVFEARPGSPTTTCGDAGGGSLQCAIPSPAFSWQPPYGYACLASGVPCVDLVTRYYADPGSACTPGVGATGQPYPQGDFVAAGANPRVLHFTKDLDWASWPTATPDPRLATLVEQFRQNVRVGTCGSGQEQHLEAARLAMQKALRQGGLAQPVPATEFPHPSAKLVVVWVGDEDDCSNPADPNRALVMDAFTPGADSCLADALQPVASRKQFPVQGYADYFLGLGRPLAAAFITSAVCTGAPGQKTCTPGTCSCTAPPGVPIDPLCSGKSTGGRLLELASTLSARGVPVVQDSVCEFDFSATLRSIAQLVTPPAGLQLPSTPASPQVAVLRIVASDGSTARVCSGPSPAADWWFVDCEGGAPREVPTSCVAIRPGSSCEANPGETYSAEYLGIVPGPSARNPQGGCADTAECVALLGGRPQDWACDRPDPQTRGTCLCTASP
jgi:hypothetical protein